MGSRGGAPGNSGVLGNKLLSDEHAFYTLFGDNGRSPIGVGSKEEPPEVQGFWSINNCQMSMILYLNCDTGRSRICVGCRGGAPGNSGVLGNKLLSDEHAFYTLFGDNGMSPIGVGSRVRSPKKPRGFGQ